jgi:hypothetical protein
LLKAVFSSKNIDRDRKFKLLDQVIAGDQSMDAIEDVLYCKAALPSLEDKMKAWKEIVENPDDLSMA